MIAEDKLLEVLEKENIYAFKADVDLDYEKFILLQSESIDELIKFAKVNNINSIFYNYIYYSEYDYKFDLEEVELNTDEDIFKLIKKDISDHNEKIDKIDFSKPRVAVIYVVYQGEKIGLMIIDYWLEEDEEILERDDQLECFIEKYEDILQEKKQKEEEQLDDLKMEFEEYLLSDREFFNCTNQTLRKHYMKTVFDNSTAIKYKSIFMKPTRFGDRLLDNTSLWIFVEMVWKKYKSNMYKYKNNIINQSNSDSQTTGYHSGNDDDFE